MATNITVRCGEERKNFMLYPGMPVEELTGILRAAFQLNEQIAGLYDPAEDVHFPLAVVSRAPLFFTTKPYYDLCVLYNDFGDEDDDEEIPYYENPAITNSDVLSLTEHQTAQLVRLFREAAPDGELDRATFEAVFARVLGAGDGSGALRTTLSKLFNLFDRDGNGLVDAREFQTGLAVIGSSSSGENKAVREAFEAYDLDGNGFISLDEMITYLTSIFAVISTSSPEVFERNQVTPEDLASATAVKCFEDLGVQTNGSLNFDQFERWYMSSDSQNLIAMDSAAVNQRSSLPSVETLRDITGLGGLDPTQVFKLFADHSDQGGAMSRSQFARCFEMIKPIDSFNSGDDYSGFTAIVDQLFDIFDTDGNGVVDITELASGLSVLCGGSRDDKVMAAFVLFDTNGDGYISKDEMVTYLTSVFKVIYQASEETREVSPEVLAKATADQCFADADIIGDGRLSFEEFKMWYSESGDRETESAVVVKKLEEVNKIQEIKKLSNIESYDLGALINFFSSQANDDGFITRDSFFKCFKMLIDRNLLGFDINTGELDEYIIGILDSVFTIFDQDKNGVVDLSEIGAGLSVLCGGSRDDKVSTAFALYDEDEDGFVSREELINYLTSVYKVLFESSPETREAAGVTPRELATTTANQCFLDIDADFDGLISYEEFKEWYNKPSTDAQDMSIVQPCEFSFAEMSTLTNLATTHVDTVFQMLAHCSDEDGMLSQMSFNGCFRALIGRNLSQQEAQRVDQLLSFIFTMFDFGNNGYVSFDDLAGGISILCGGSHLDKIRSVFALYDIAGTGFITQDELTSHLTSVFTVLLTTSPSTKDRLGVTPRQFAEICAEDAFSSLNGQMSFSQFNVWCSDNIAHQGSSGEVETPRSLEDIRRLSGLQSSNIVEVFEAFAECADERGLISRGSFTQCLFAIMSLQRDMGVVANELLANELFDIFDADGNGVVDFTELASGLSLLCGGSRDEKVSAAFGLFDINGDGYISKDEMVTYLTSVFRVIYATRPELYEALQVGPEELSLATTEEAFADADVNHDGQISFFEFKNWYSQGITGSLLPGADDDDEEEDEEDEDEEQFAEVSLDYVREASGLKNCDVHTMFAIFADAATEDGMLTCEAYFDCFSAIVQRASFTPDYDALNRMLMSIFYVYDTQGTGSVELIEILCGMTVLCGGDREDKVRAAFGLIDADNDGFISKEELFEYLRSIFRMLHDTKNNQVTVDASTLAAATTEAAFQQAGTTRNGKISLTAFTNWYSNASSFEVGNDDESEESSEENDVDEDGEEENPSSFGRARWLLNMDKHSLNDLLDTLVEAGPDGTLTRAQFLNAMLMLVRLGGNLDPRTSQFEESAALMEAIFTEFDTNNSGRIDLSQVASGISILCAVPMSDKIDFAFALYDIEGDGEVSFEALTEYMASVFKVLFVTSPDLRSMVDGQLDSEKLAEATTLQAFQEAGLNSSSTLEKQLFENFVRIGLGGL